MISNLPFDIKNPKKIISDITKEPLLLSKFYKFIFDSYDKIDTTTFIKNIKFLSKKINSFTKEKNYDIYISLSCILGAFLGDSLGSHCEFLNSSPENSKKIFTNARFQNGQITDDSEMAMSKAFAIMDMPNINFLDQNLLFYYYGIWISSKPLDKGITTSKALNLFKIDNMAINLNNLFSPEIKRNIHEKNKSSKANGALMRISTFIVWFYYRKKNDIKNDLNSNDKLKFLKIYNEIYENVCKDVIITHPNKENIVSCSIFSFMTLCVMNQFDGKKTIEKLNILLTNKEFTVNEEKNLKDIILNSIKDFNKKDFDKVKYFNKVTEKIGYYVHAFKLSLFYLTDERILKNSKDAYLNIIEEICNYGGDTDTNAAIVGTLIGPLIGYTNFTKNKVYDNFLEFFSKKRMLYTSILMYFFVDYLDNIFNIKKTIEVNKEIKFNFLKCFLNMINNDLSKK